MSTVKGPTLEQLECLSDILHNAEHKRVADRMLAAFMWACWPDWYEDNYEKALQWLLESKTTQSSAKH